MSEWVVRRMINGQKYPCIDGLGSPVLVPPAAAPSEISAPKAVSRGGLDLQLEAISKEFHKALSKDTGKQDSECR